MDKNKQIEELKELLDYTKKSDKEVFTFGKVNKPKKALIESLEKKIKQLEDNEIVTK